MSPQESIIAQLNWRYATKLFDSTKKISAAHWQVLAESLRLAPSSYGLQPWQFIIVQDMGVRKQLTAHSWNQPQVEACSHYVVLAARKNMDEAYVRKFIESIAKVRGVSLEQLSAYEQMMVGDLVKGPRNQVISAWAQRQTYIAMGFLLETAALLHIDACPMEGFDPKAYDKILNLENTDYASVASVALGYRAAGDKYQGNAKVRFATADVIKMI